MDGPANREIRCRRCQRSEAWGPVANCRECGGSLGVAYDESAWKSDEIRSALASRPPGLWRYREFLPIDRVPAFGERTGGTPLVEAPRLAKALGMRSLFLKNEGVCHPTASFKDRPVAVATALALEFGFRTLGCPSTGNLAGSVAAFARLAGLEARILVPDDLEDTKVAAAAVFGPGVVRVRGPYDEAKEVARALAEKHRWAIANLTLRPFYGEGSKTIAYEIVEGLGGSLPDQVVIPMGSGLLLDRVARGFEEWRRAGLAEGAPPRLFGVQPQGCSPIVRALVRGNVGVDPVRPRTIVRSLAVGDPMTGPEAIAAIRSSGGWGTAPSDEEAIEGIETLARTEGIFGETACGVAVAGLRRLLEEGRADRDARTVAILTGNGLKTAEALSGRLRIPIADPSPEAVEAALERAP